MLMQASEKMDPTEIKISCKVRLPSPRAASSIEPSLEHVVVLITLNKGYIAQESKGHLKRSKICLSVVKGGGRGGNICELDLAEIGMIKVEKVDLAVIN